MLLMQPNMEMFLGSSIIGEDTLAITSCSEMLSHTLDSDISKF